MQSNWVAKKQGWKILLFLSIFIVATLAIPAAAATFWYQSNTMPTDAGVEKVIVIQKGESVGQVSNSLENMGLIRSALAFRLYLKLHDLKPEIQAGSFKIKSGQTPEQVIQALSVGRVDKWVTIREGLRIEEVGAQLAKEFPLKADDFVKAAKEGYMFPDTYLLPIDADASKAVSILTDNFHKKVELDLKDSISSSGLNLEQIIILASIVERESRSGEERPIIAGILIKRWQEGMRLEVDATVQYALGFQPEEQTWWKKTLTDADLKIDSPYNTRKNLGLPPSPICNPGLESIKAVIKPTTTSYYYYLHDKDGKVHFAKTLDEHNANVAKYL